MLILISILILLIAVFCFLLRTKYNYWNSRGFPYLKGCFPFGNVKDLILTRKFASIAYKDLYDQLDGNKFGGFFILWRPALLLRDPEVIKHFLIKDFNNFHDRGVTFLEEIEPINKFLPNFEGDAWKQIRATLSPTFSSGKIKMMFKLMKACSDQKILQIKKSIESAETQEIRNFAIDYTLDVIATCAFGMDLNADKRFKQVLKKVKKISWYETVRNSISNLPAGWIKLFPQRCIPKDVADFFTEIVTANVKYREKNNLKRDDYFDLLLQLKNKGHVDPDFEPSDPIDEQAKKFGDSTATNGYTFSMSTIVAHTFMFLAAGQTPPSETIAHCIYELALNPEIQEKLQDEISALLETQEELSYQAIQEMHYLDKIFSETIRKYPTTIAIRRRCNNTCKIPDTDLIIEKGTPIVITNMGLHHDPQHFPDPAQFDPERFSEECKRSRHPFAYLPMGEGPRKCIAGRFGEMMIKTIVAALIINFQFSPSVKTEVPLQFEPRAKGLTAKGGIWLNISARN